MDQLHPFSISRAAVAGVDRQGAVEIVDDQEQFFQEVGDPLIRLLATLAVDPLAVVVELRGFPQPAVVEIVALALKLGDRVGRKG